MDKLQINITIDGKESERARDYRYEIKVDRKIIAEGVFKGIPRIENLIDKFREYLISPWENKGKVPKLEQTFSPAHAPIKSNRIAISTRKKFWRSPVSL